MNDMNGNLAGLESAMNLAAGSNAQQEAKWTALGQAAMNAGFRGFRALDALSCHDPIDSWTGTDHATGGILNAASRFLSWDGMHTMGESGAEAILPLDTLWRKMGMIFDNAFSANLDALQYSVMPPIPAAAPPAIDEDALGEKIAVAVREAVSGLAIEMDKRKVAKIIKAEVSKDIADDVNNRRWTT